MASEFIRASRDIIKRNEGEIAKFTAENDAAKAQVARIIKDAKSQNRPQTAEETTAIGRILQESVNRNKKIEENKYHNNDLKRKIQDWERNGSPMDLQSRARRPYFFCSEV